MDQISEGSLLWEPSPKVIENANLTHYMKWLNQKYDLTLDNYPALWQWSVDNLELFWDTLWDYFALIYSKRARLTLTSREMPGTVWFDGAELNFAENVIAKMAEGRPILLYKAEGSDLVAIERDEILVQVKAFAQMLNGGRAG